ncbi:MAG: TatD family hydrolase [Kiritimatiellaeota bacterium]|nr:TatD family hydrolase [Kiritimatiellota bacterium]
MMDGPGLFDSHLHLDPADDVAPLLERARQAGVGRFLVVGGSLDESRFCVDSAQAETGVWATAGVHPHAAAQFDGRLEPFRELVQRPEVVAVGEIGLDYYYDNSPREAQRRVFSAFLGLAVEAEMPVVVHCREAYADCHAVLRECTGGLVGIELHSFTGGVEWAERFLELGACFSFNGIATFAKAHNVREILRITPPDRVLAETDSPYLAPVPVRGRRNEPAFVKHVVERIAAVRNWTFDEAARITTENAVRFFRLP